jgi:hypothetical protein
MNEPHNDKKMKKQIKLKYKKKVFCVEVSKFLYELSVICLDKLPHTTSGDRALSNYIVKNVYIETENFNQHVIDSLIDLVVDEALIKEFVKWELKNERNPKE